MTSRTLNVEPPGSVGSIAPLKDSLEVRYKVLAVGKELLIIEPHNTAQPSHIFSALFLSELPIMSQQRQVTDTRHNDYIGSDANSGRIPGADQASTGHHYVSVFPKGKSWFLLSVHGKS